MDQGSNKNHSPAYNFTPTVTNFCVMWEGLSLPHDTKFGNCRCKIVDSRSFHSWSLIHGLRWSGLIKVGPGDIMISTLLKLICATGPRLLKHSLTEDKINMHSQYHGYWWPGYLHRQSINSHGIDLVIPEYCGCSTRILTHRGWDRITDSLQQAFLITFFEWIHLYFDSNLF